MYRNSLFYMIIILLLLMPTTGCKQSDNIINNTNNNQINNGTVTGVYKTEILKIPEGYTIKKNNITLGNGRIYALCTKE